MAVAALDETWLGHIMSFLPGSEIEVKDCFDNYIYSLRWGLEADAKLLPIPNTSATAQYMFITYGQKKQVFCCELHHCTCESRRRLRGLGSPEKEALGVGGLVAVGWGFQEPVMGSRVTRAFLILIFRGPSALSIMFLIVLLHPLMPSASKVAWDRM